MKYSENHIPKYSPKRPGTTLKAAYLTIHSTANPSSTAQNERDWLMNPSNKTSTGWHTCVDENGAVEAIPLNEVAYHAGTGEGNNTSIGIELCESGDCQKVIENAVELIAGMLFERKWGIDRLKRHYDWSGKNCPRILNLNGGWQGWEEFKTLVACKLAELANNETEEIEVKEKRYQNIEEMPDWAKPTVEKLISMGALSGDGHGLDLSLDMLRIFVVGDRVSLFDK